MKINKFNTFRENRIEKLFEHFIKESIVYYSPRLRELLASIKDNEISRKLLDIEHKDIKNDITFIDIDDKQQGYFTFTRMDKAKEKLKKGQLISLAETPNMRYSDFIFSDDTANIYSKDRNPIKVTRIINKLLSDEKISSSEIDIFYRKYMSKLNREDIKFMLVEGDDIAFWYKKENYYKIDGSLGSSCMRDKKSAFFEIYTKNPEVCKMLILVDENNKLLGRSLVWTISNHKQKITDGQLIFMDRQYTIDSTDIERFRNYANKEGWAYKTYNSVSDVRAVTYNNTVHYIDMEIRLNEESYSYYPYMDTFKRYSHGSDMLFNNDSEDSEHEGDYLLNDTDGGYTEISSGVYSEYEDRTIDDDYAIWSEEVQSYLHIDNAVEVTTGYRSYHGWYPDGYEYITWDGWNEENIHINDSVYSDYYDYDLLSDESTQAVTDIESDGEPSLDYIHHNDSDGSLDGNTSFIDCDEYNDSPWFKKLSYEHSDWNDSSCMLKTFIFKNYKDEYSLKKFKTVVYKIENLSLDASDIGFNSEMVLLEKDAIILNCQIDKSKPLLTDLFDYHHDLDEVLPNYYTYLKSYSKKIEINNEEQRELFSLVYNRMKEISENKYIEVELSND